MRKNPILALSAILCGAASAAPANHSAVDITSQLVMDLTDFERAAPTTGPTAQIQSCLSLVFRKWADSYNALLKVTPLSYPDIKVKMDEYATVWYRARHNLAVADFYHPDIEAKLERILRDGIRISNREMKPFPDIRFSIDDVDRRSYNLYLRFCLSRSFLTRALTDIPEENEGRVLPPEISTLYQGKASWKATRQGGLEPILHSGATLTPPESSRGGIAG